MTLIRMATSKYLVSNKYIMATSSCSLLLVVLYGIKMSLDHFEI